MKTAEFWKTVAIIGLPLAVIASIILAINYINDQQNLRMLANEPQEWMARELVSRLEAGMDPRTIALGQSLDIRQSPAPYLDIYDEQGTSITGSGQLNSAVPTVPIGVLQVARAQGVNRITWEPVPGLREAIVVVPVSSGGYVLAGRSLNYVEEKENMLTKRVFLGWLGAMLTILATSILWAYLLQKRTK